MTDTENSWNTTMNFTGLRLDCVNHGEYLVPHKYSITCLQEVFSNTEALSLSNTSLSICQSMNHVLDCSYIKL